MTRRLLGGLLPAVCLLLLALGAIGCNGDGATGPTAIVSPSPSPSPSVSPSPSASPTPRIAATCQISGDGIVFGIGPKQPRVLDLLVFDADKTLIENRAGHWSHTGPIQPTGPDNGSKWEYYAVAAGFANVSVAVPGTPGCQFRITIVESFEAYVAALLAAKN